MILISKEEAERVREAFPKAQITRTCIQKSKRHRYYMPEVFNYLKLIADTNNEAAKLVLRKPNPNPKSRLKRGV